MRQTDYDDAKAFTPEATYYITAAWARENVTRVPINFVVGNESVTYADGVKYLNARLSSGSSYSFFAIIDLQSDIVRNRELVTSMQATHTLTHTHTHTHTGW